MKIFLPVILLLCFQFTIAQTIKPRVIDSLNNKPLGYAIVIYNNNQKVTYTDLNGYFTLQLDSIKKNDSVTIRFLGYERKAISISNLYDRLTIKMIPEVLSLQPVIVTNCRSTAEFTLNKKIKRIKQYVGPGPETRLVIMARYNNVTGHNSYIKKVSILIDERSPNLQIPIRLRWYDWNDETQMPGKELTDTNIVVYPYKEGWNDFEIADNTIQFPKDWIVFGLEFIYPPEYTEQYKARFSNQEKISWLNDMKHRWSLSMQYVEDEHESGYYIVNNSDITAYTKKYDRYYIRPALRFTVVFCRD